MAEPTKDQRASLKDAINYQPDNYLSPDEITLIQNTFKGNNTLVNILRKLFIPTITDAELPLESFGSDTFLLGREYAQIPEAEIKSLIVAREDAIKFICGGLIKLKVIANMSKETDIEASFRRSKDSAK